MEARRAYVGSKSFRQLWIILAALMVAACLGIAGAVLASGVASPSKAPQIVRTYPAPGTVLRQDTANGPSVNNPSRHHQTVF